MDGLWLLAWIVVVGNFQPQDRASRARNPFDVHTSSRQRAPDKRRGRYVRGNAVGVCEGNPRVWRDHTPRDGAAVHGRSAGSASNRPLSHFSNCGLRWDEGSLG